MAEFTTPPTSIPPEEKKWRFPFILLAFSIFAILIFGLIWLFAYSPSSPVGGGWFLFSFAAGLSMIVLPCTLPLAFVIVPLSMGKGYRKGLIIALMFGLGVTLTLSMYGLLTAIVGKLAIGALGLQIEAVKNWLYVIAGIFVIVFALSEIGLARLRLPSYMGAAPAMIGRQGDYAKALMLGLFLGNVGIGCPSPATYVLLSRIATTDDIFYGWMLFLVHGIGRVTPLIFLAILGIIGINATKYILKHKDAVERGMGWTLIFVGGFILALGLFSHDWYVYSGIHALLEKITFEAYFHDILEGRLGVSAPHLHGVPSGPYLAYGGYFMVAVWTLVLLWFLYSQKNKALVEPEPTRSSLLKVWRLRRKYYITLIILLTLTFGWALPHQFVNHWGAPMENHNEMDMDNHNNSSKKVEIKFSSSPEAIVANKLTRLTFALSGEDNKPISDLKIGHERILHVIIVSKDFSSFAHIHPEDFGQISENDINQSTFSVNYTFPKSGVYYALVGFDQNGTDINALQMIGVVGEQKQLTVIKDTSVKKVFSSYDVSLISSEDTIRSGVPLALRYTISQNGLPVTDLMPYLAAPMHLAIFSYDFSYYTHAHGSLPGAIHGGTIPSRFGPSIDGNITFPWHGTYRIFGQFNHLGKVITTDFTVEVELGAVTKEKLIQTGNSH